MYTGSRIQNTAAFRRHERVIRLYYIIYYTIILLCDEKIAFVCIRHTDIYNIYISYTTKRV